MHEEEDNHADRLNVTSEEGACVIPEFTINCFGWHPCLECRLIARGGVRSDFISYIIDSYNYIRSDAAFGTNNSPMCLNTLVQTQSITISNSTPDRPSQKLPPLQRHLLFTHYQSNAASLCVSLMVRKVTDMVHPLKEGPNQVAPWCLSHGRFCSHTPLGGPLAFKGVNL